MNTVLVVGGNEELARRIEARASGRRARFRVTRRDWSAVRGASRSAVALPEADVLLADLTAPDAYAVRGLARLRNARPNVALLIRTDAPLPHEGALARLLENPDVDFVRPLADADELGQRLRRLLTRRHPTPNPAHDWQRGVANREHSLLTELRRPENGRLDAQRVAAFFGIPLAEVARALGRSLSSVHKTPAAPSLQEGLYVFERVAAALLTLAGSAENARAYLNLPEAQLGNKTPLTLLREGKGEIVAQMLDDMLTGQPS